MWRLIFKAIRWGILVVLIVASIVAATAGKEEAVIITEVSDWETMDPAFITLMQESSIAMNLHCSLVTWAYGSVDIVGDLAERWETSEDGTVYTFFLRKGVKWHKGYGEVTAEDVKYSIDRILDPATGAYLAKQYTIIKEVKVLDKYTVQITLHEPFAPFLELMVGYKAMFIVPKRAVEELGENFGLNPVGCGPFEWVSGDPKTGIILKAFDDYYLGRSRIDKIVFKHIPHDPVAYAAFEAGELDMVSSVADPDVLERYKADPNIVVTTDVGLNLNYIVLNHQQEPFNDIRVRKALNYAINKEELFATILKGIGADLTGPVPQRGNFYEPNVTRYEYNIEKAKQLLAEAGYPNGFKTTLYAYIGGPAVPVTTAVQAYLKKIGVDAEIKALEISAWASVVTTGTTPMAFMRITRPPDPDGFLMPVIYSGSDPRWNFGHYRNPEVDKLILEGRRTPDPEKRREIYSKIQKIVAEDAVNIWLFSDIIATAYRPYIKGFKLDPLWNIRLYPCYIEK